jgi:hypothetical protein
MFEHVVLRRSDGGDNISVGQIAEALFYYQRLHLIIDRANLFSLIRQIGIDHVITLIRRHEVTAVYCEEMLATHTTTYAGTEFHGYAEITLAGDKDHKLDTPEERLQFELERQGLQKKEVRRFVKDFFKLVPIRKFSGNYFLNGGIVKAAEQEILDDEYVRQALRRAIEVIPGGYVLENELKFELLESDKGFCVFSNIDFNQINKRRSELTPSVEPLRMAHLLTSILDSSADLAISSFYGGDFVTSAINSSIIQVRHAELLRRTKLNQDAKQQFVDLALPDTPTLAEVIDSGERSFNEFLKLLDQSRRFKDWLHTVNPDENLVRTYMRDVSSEGWIQKLPAKSIRYILTTAIAANNPVAGFVSGIVDNFFLEKLLSGWRPNHFVSKKLSPFVNSRNG